MGALFYYYGRGHGNYPDRGLLDQVEFEAEVENVR